jgi:hypothetical protein
MAGKFIAQTWKAFLGNNDNQTPQRTKRMAYDEILPTEQNPNKIQIKMNPTRIAEKGWEDSYKLAKLISLQEEEIESGEIYTEQFGGIHPNDLDEAFAIRNFSSARHHSPMMRSQSKTKPGRNVMSSTDRLIVSVDRSEPKFSLLEHTLRDSDIRLKILSEDKFLPVQSIIDEQAALSEEEKSMESDRSNHFVLSTMKVLNKEADTALDNNLLHLKLQQKKRLAVNPVRESLLDQFPMVQAIAEDEMESPSKMLDSQDFVLNNTMSSVLNSHREERIHTKHSLDDAYGREFSESQINVFLESDANPLPDVTPMVTNIHMRDEWRGRSAGIVNRKLI